MAELKESWTANQKTIDFLLLTAITLVITEFTEHLLCAEHCKKQFIFKPYL